MKKPELKVAGPQKLDNGDYSKQLEHMHVELNDLAKWLQHTRERLAVVIEGRDTAGKGGVIGALSDELNPRQCHTVALSKPGERELGQWYFQRYQKISLDFGGLQRPAPQAADDDPPFAGSHSGQEGFRHTHRLPSAGPPTLA